MKSTINILLFAVMAIMFLPLNNADAQRGRGRMKAEWKELGSRLVTKGADHDVINVTFRDGTFTKVQFRVLKSRVHIDNMTIHFDNGDVQHFKIDKNFDVGEWSPVLDLPGNKRFIDRVTFNYHTKFFATGKGKIVLFGKS
ncbi:MAG TPA: hypothetical protein PLU49_10575 [Saprospiraceae bacterium]|nr:hypothetical protein [Saprospirales bacterium]HRQ30508.1 hypothetical protein [Saprospiraceae bacterium]